MFSWDYSKQPAPEDIFEGCPREQHSVARNTATDEILAVYKMGEAPPKLKANIPATPSGEPSIGSGNLSTSKKDRF